MKPRQTSRNFLNNPNNTPPALPFQAPPSQQQTALPLPPIQQSAPTINPTIPPALRDVDLTKLGLNFDDKTNLIQQLASNPNVLSQDDIMKCFQAIYAKNGADILHNQTAYSDPTMQSSVSPPDQFPKILGNTISSSNNSVSNIIGSGVVSASCSGAACSRESIINSGLNSSLGSSSSGIVSSNSAGSGSSSCAIGSGSGGASGAVSFNNNINKANNGAGNVGTGQQNKQDIPFLSAQQHQAVATSSAINNFRVPTTNAYHHSPMIPSVQSQQQKSVLSIHQQQQQSDRRFTNHHQNSNTACTSFSNLNINNMSGASSSSSTPFDAINPNQIKNNNPMSNATAITTRSSQAMMDALKVHSSLENLMESGFLSSHGKDNSNLNSGSLTNGQQNALTGHQQLQRLLKASGVGSVSSANQMKSQSQLAAMASSFSSNMPPKNDPQIIQQRGSTTAITKSHTTHNQRHLPGAISPSQATSSPVTNASHSLPKSLLNLAACSKSTHDTGSKLSALNQLTSGCFKSASGQKNLSNTKSGYPVMNTKLLNRSNINNNLSGVNQKSSATPLDPNELLQKIISSGVRTAQNHQTNAGQNRSKHQTPLSLLSDDHLSARRQQLGPANSAHQASAARSTHLSPNKQQAGSSHDDINSANPFDPSEPKDNFLASLQERAARAGVSIDEINDRNTMLLNNSTQSTANQQNLGMSSVPHPTTSSDPLDTLNQCADFDQEEIESALSRVEARNDLSLLYPPVLLGQNSQKQINALSAGFQVSEEPELFTNEVKRIVSEECNIIYECKQCSNLFRSLTNLIKHRRFYCTDSEEPIQQPLAELQRRPNRNVHDLSRNKYQNAPDTERQAPRSQPNVLTNESFDSQKSESNAKSDMDHNQSANQNKSKYQLRGKNPMSVSSGDHPQPNKYGSMKIDSKGSSINSLRNIVDQASSSSLTPTSLSKLLQSQPRNRLPGIRDNSALMNALRNKTSALTGDDSFIGNSTRNAFPATSVEDVDLMPDLNEQLVSKSSLAQTLLSESAKSSSPAGGQRGLDQATSRRHVASKRKLEDCISKVKRGKLGTNETAGNGDESDQTKIDGRSHSVTSDKSNNSSSSALLRALTKPAEIFKGTHNENQSKLKEKHAPTEKTQKGSSILAKSHSSEKNSFLDNVDRHTDTTISSPLFEEYTCDICKQNFTERETLYVHTIDQHKTSKTIYPCIFCSLSFIMLENVCRHIMDVHKKGKMQVTRLKEVVRSRSYVSEDFTGCEDFPSTPPLDYPRDQMSQKTIDVNDDDKSSVETMTPKLVITEETTTTTMTSRNELDTTKSSPSPRIIEDTISVSTSTCASQEANSEQKSSQATLSSYSVGNSSQRNISLSQQSTSIQTQISNNSRTILGDSVDDESDLLSMVDASDEDLAQLCEQEEEIAKLKERQGTIQQTTKEAPKLSPQVKIEDHSQSRSSEKQEDELAVLSTQTNTDESGLVSEKARDWGDQISVASTANSSDSEEYVIHEDNVDAEMDSEGACDQTDAFGLVEGASDEANQLDGQSQDSSPAQGGCSRSANDYLDSFSMPEENSMECNNTDAGGEESDSGDIEDESNLQNEYTNVDVENQDNEGQDDMNDDDEDAEDEDDDQEDEDDDEDIDDDAESVDDDDDDEGDDNDNDDEDDNDNDKQERNDSSSSNCKIGGSSSSMSGTSSAYNGSSSGNAGGGGMKLKIQLKTQPDEKTKVYRIV